LGLAHGQQGTIQRDDSVANCWLQPGNIGFNTEVGEREAMDSMRRVVQQMQGGRIASTEQLGEHGIKIQFDANQTDGAAVSNEIIFARQDTGWKVALTVFKENDPQGAPKLRTVFPFVPEQVVSTP
jgi:hypothetical protein